MTDTITGPRLAPRSGAAKQLVVFLHGYGADGKDLIEIGKQWQRILPEACFVAPNAPERCAQSPMMRSSFRATILAVVDHALFKTRTTSLRAHEHGRARAAAHQTLRAMPLGMLMRVGQT